MSKAIDGFSKLNKQQKIEWLTQQFAPDPGATACDFEQWQHPDPGVQKIIDGFTENTISNYTLPYSIAPNFMINGRVYAVPMVIEESSVVAAASSAAKFWFDRGGFHAEVLGTVKLGQVHFRWVGDPGKLKTLFPGRPRAPDRRQRRSYRQYAATRRRHPRHRTAGLHPRRALLLPDPRVFRDLQQHGR